MDWPRRERATTATPARDYHPLLAIAAGTGEVLMSRLREGRANSGTSSVRGRYGGATAQLTVRADSGFYGHTVVSACREMDVRFSITVRQHASLRDLIEAIPEEDWTPIPYWMDGAADVAETTYTPFDQAGRRPPELGRFPTRPLRQIQLSDRDGETLELEADHRTSRGAPYDLKLRAVGAFRANGAWLAVA